MAARSPARSLLRTLVLILIGLELLYLIAGNVFLNTEIGPRTVNRKPEKWSLTWSSGWTVIPGRVSLREVVFEQSGRQHDLRVTAESVAADVEVSALPERRFLTDSLVARGVTGEAVHVPDRKPPPRPPGPGSGWTVELRGVAADDLRSLAFGETVFEGSGGRLGGDLRLVVRGSVELTDGYLDWQGLVLRQDDMMIAEPLSLTFEGGFSPFDPRREKRLDWLDHVSGRFGITGAMSRLAILRHLVKGARWIETLDGSGQLTASLEIVKGHVGPGSVVQATAPDLRLDFLGYSTEGSGRVDASVEPAGAGEGLARVEVTFDDFTVRRKPLADPHLHGRGMRLVATSRDPNLRDGMQELDVVLDMPRTEVPDMGVYGAYLPAHLGLEIESGRGAIGFHLEGSAVDQTAAGEVVLTAEDVAGRFQDLDFEGALEVDTKISGGDLDNFHLEIVGTRMTLRNVELRDGRNTAEKGWWMTVDVPLGILKVGAAPRLAAEVDVRMKDTRPLMALFGEVKPWLDRYERILTVKDVTAHSKVAMARNRMSFRELSIGGRKLEGRAELELGRDLRRGILYVRFHGVPVGLEVDGAKRDWKLTYARRWFDAKVAADWR